MPHITSPPAPSYRRVMIFIDGGYLREGLKRVRGHDEISCKHFENLIYYLVNLVEMDNIKGELIRTYYYDAIVDESEVEKRREQNLYFDELRRFVQFCTIRLGRLIKTNEGYRQKGVDILIAIDMLTKAYEDHYDIAIILTGDGDFVELVEAVKNTGKRVYGAYFEDQVSEELRGCLDFRITLNKENIARIIAYRL